MALDTSYAYYYQVQAQIKPCGANFGDFVAWSEKELFVERIYSHTWVIQRHPFLVKCQIIQVAG